MIRKTLLVLIVMSCILLFFLPENTKLIPTFRMTEEPNVVMKGSKGRTLTIDISFGKEEIEKWFTSLTAPYPLLLLDADWIDRSPSIVKIIKEKKIPSGLLGKEGEFYKEEIEGFHKEIAVYEKQFGEKPLWFRTKDQVFPENLQKAAWNQKINLLGSSKVWTANELPTLGEGEILAVPIHQDEKIPFQLIDQLKSKYTFQSIEETFFGYSIQTKKFPQ